MTGHHRKLKIDSDHAYITENAKNSHTTMYESVQNEKVCIVRRGTEMKIGLRCQRNLRPHSDLVQFAMKFKDKNATPKTTNGTRANFRLRNGGGGSKGRWTAKFDRQQDHEWFTVLINIPVDVPVGEWYLTIHTNGDDKYKFQTPIYILFNPLDKDDPVYIDSTNDYVFQEAGNIFTGKELNATKWHFSQFDEEILPVMWYLLGTVARKQHNHLRSWERGDPVKVARAITSIVSTSNEGEGLLEGNWSGDYSGGTNPDSWTGSGPIFREYASNGHHAVKYGQCWVFAAVVNTACRAIGIPCRHLTNLGSGHDLNSYDLRITEIYNEHDPDAAAISVGKCAGEIVWTFHCWNEVWMDRRDLPQGYGGWQVIDGTPQEQDSSGVYLCGPCPVTAIRHAHVGLNYDVPFVFSEVNADCYIYYCNPKTGRKKFVRIDTKRVGKQVCTQAHGSSARQNITNNYKPSEGSSAERHQYLTAVRRQTGARTDVDDDEMDDESDATVTRGPAMYRAKDAITGIIIPVRDAAFGSSFVPALKVRNEAFGSRTILVHIKVKRISYRQCSERCLLVGNGILDLNRGQTGTVSLPLSPEDYLGQALVSCMIQVDFILKVKETGDVLIFSDTFQLIPPLLVLSMTSGRFEVMQPTSVWIKFRNPLPISMTGCCYMVEAPGMSKLTQQKYRSVSSGEEVSIEVKLTPTRRGPTTIIATFHSKEIDRLRDSKQVLIV